MQSELKKEQMVKSYRGVKFGRRCEGVTVGAAQHTAALEVERHEWVQRQLAFCSKRVYLSHLCFCSLSLGNQLLAHTMIVLVQVIDFQVKMSKS